MGENAWGSNIVKGAFCSVECLTHVEDRAKTRPQLPPFMPPPMPRHTVQPGYEPLAKVLQAALDQSALGKGRDRHATTGKPFTSQPICEIGRMVGIGYNVGQAMKKGQEAMRLPTERAQAELLGAIVYMASAYLLLGEGDGSAEG